MEFRTFLQEELVRRCRDNPRTSIRSFAKVVGMDSSSLSQYLGKKRQISSKLVSRICDRLAVDPALKQNFILGHVQTESKVSPTEEALAMQIEYHVMELDRFEVIAKWYYAAILELTFVPGASFEPQAIAKRFGISVIEAASALERLERMNLLARKKSGRFIKTNLRLTSFKDEVTTPFLRKNQRETLELASRALEEVDVLERDHSNIIMSISVKKLPEAKRRITQFRRDLCEFLETGRRSRVYQLGIQLFPLDRSSK